MKKYFRTNNEYGTEGDEPSDNIVIQNLNQAEFTVAEDCTVYVGLDSRVENLPVWLADYEKTELSFGNSSDVTFVVYAKQYAAGDTVILGTNGQSAYCVNYNVMVVKTAPNSVMGDVNADGAFDIADVVLLQKWLLAVPDTHLAGWKAADLCEDDRLDVFDLCLMKRELVNR